MILHYCRKFEQKIKQETFEQSLRKKISRFENLDSFRQAPKIHTFLSETLFVFKYDELTRVIIQKETIDNKDVHFVRDIIIRTKEHFWTTTDFPKIQNGYWINENPLSQEDIDDYRSIQNIPSSNNNKEPVPYYLKSWINELKIDIHQHIFESEDWIRYTLLEDKEKGMHLHDRNDFYRLIQSIYFFKNDNFKKEIITEEINNNIGLYAVKHKNFDVGVIYTYKKIDNKDILLLLGGANFKRQQSYWEEIKAKVNNFDIKSLLSIDDIAKYALRSYPNWVLNDNNIDTWSAIEFGSELNLLNSKLELSNLSLLQEQINYLNHFRFPAYINAQAGSGKSTILYYIFAHTYWLKCVGEQIDNIIFLTENEELLNKSTIPAVKALLSDNADLQGFSEDNLIEVDNCFATFKIFLLNLLDEESKEYFSPTKYLDFSTFKNKFENTINYHRNQHYTAEESWFIINTYIRGYDIEQDILKYDPNIIIEFSQEYFENIVRDVYQNFYIRLIDNDNYWDKTKIIRHLSKYKEKQIKYNVIFCDEAQDFSRISLRFIFQQSLFLNYKLEENEQIPVVLAGDHTQTVNPTGFKVARTKDIFYDELKSKIDEYSYMPEYNYRSAQAVVNLANFIQYYRRKVLDIEINRPQKSKKPETEEGTQNIFLKYEDVLSNDDIKKLLKFKTFIIPKDNHERQDYIEKNKFFEWNIDAKQSFYTNIQTAVETKGLDIKQVVVFGFGDFYLQKFGEFSWDKITSDDLFNEKFFFNKLYVAITRAQNELIIIDSETAYNNFWTNLINPNSLINNDWRELENTNQNLLVQGATIVPSREEDEKENAIRAKKQAVLDRNANGLFLVAKRFYRLGDNKQYLECLGLSEELKENWENAIGYYQKLGNHIDFLSKISYCYLKIKKWDDIRKLPNTLKTDKHLVNTIISNLMLTRFDEIDIIELSRNKGLFQELIQDLSYREEIIDKISELVRICKNDKHKLYQVSQFYQNIVKESEYQRLEPIALIHFEVQSYDYAVELWKKIGEDEKKPPRKEYIEALIKIYGLKNDSENKLVALYLLLSGNYSLSSTEESKIKNEILGLWEADNNKIYEDFAVNKVILYVLILQDIQEKYEHLIVKLMQELENKEASLTIVFYEELLLTKKTPQKLVNFIVEHWAKYSYKIPHKTENWLSKLNEKYKVISLLYSIPYQPFTEVELSNVLDEPKNIIAKPNDHFKNITIKNFRRFNHLELNDIGQFNLIVGDNNVGKTSLLEALLFTPDENEFFERLSFAYMERICDTNFKNIKKDFWKDFVLKTSNNDNISLTLTENRNIWYYEFSSFNYEIDLESIREIESKDSIKNPLVPFGKGYRNDLEQIYFEKISPFKKIRERFIKNMKVFIPEIEAITGFEGGGIGIEEEGSNESTPLHQFGEGANKLFRILMQLTFQKDKKLMIDEIDSGIHYSRFPKFWEVILKVAYENNIQIFASTHNIECVQYFKEVLENYDNFKGIMSEEEFKKIQNSSRTITLYQTKNKEIKARTRNFEAFQEAIEEGYNIRGGE